MWWWLSFCDVERPLGQQFLGVAIVAGRTMVEAVQIAARRGCNPGGEVKGWPLPIEADLMPKLEKQYAWRLLSKGEAAEADAAIGLARTSPGFRQ